MNEPMESMHTRPGSGWLRRAIPVAQTLALTALLALPAVAQERRGATNNEQFIDEELRGAVA